MDTVLSSASQLKADLIKKKNLAMQFISRFGEKKI